MAKQKADQRLLFVCNISENVSEQGSGSDGDIDGFTRYDEIDFD